MSVCVDVCLCLCAERTPNFFRVNTVHYERIKMASRHEKLGQNLPVPSAGKGEADEAKQEATLVKICGTFYFFKLSNMSFSAISTP